MFHDSGCYFCITCFTKLPDSHELCGLWSVVAHTYATIVHWVRAAVMVTLACWARISGMLSKYWAFSRLTNGLLVASVSADHVLWMSTTHAIPTPSVPFTAATRPVEQAVSSVMVVATMIALTVVTLKPSCVCNSMFWLAVLATITTCHVSVPSARQSDPMLQHPRLHEPNVLTHP